MRRNKTASWLPFKKKQGNEEGKIGAEKLMANVQAKLDKARAEEQQAAK